MFTNDLKKGDYVRLRNGWDARIEDNKKGLIRLCTVFGLETEMGSVYSHDIVWLWVGSKGKTVEQARTCPTQVIQLTDKQKALRKKAF